ncbi:MAG: hypothetical protein L3V56_05960 [Candidatus Magnetoovum sp. WYHC-5]|nr:hypothetical protein [Candidatus Magnetoovum sp. WYHC-5]
MEVKVSGEEITISGQIKTIEDYQKVKQVMNSIIDGNSKLLIIYIPDSLSITSSVIGYFLKLVYENNITLNMHVKDDRLYNLLDVLNLVSVFNVKKM